MKKSGKRVFLVVATLLVVTACVCISILLLYRAHIDAKLNDFYHETDKTAEARFDAVISALKTGDAETLRSMFSREALSEIEDIDTKLEALISLSSENITAHEAADVRGGYVIDGLFDYSYSYYAVKALTDGKKCYYLFILETPISSHSTGEDIGIQILGFSGEEDSEGTKYFGLLHKPSGIYLYP